MGGRGRNAAYRRIKLEREKRNMIKHISYVYRRINIFLDVIASAAAWTVALMIRSYIDTGTFFSSEHFQRYLWFLYLVIILWPLLLNFNGLYPTNRARTIKRSLSIIIKSSIQGLLIVFALLFALRKSSMRGSIFL